MSYPMFYEHIVLRQEDRLGETLFFKMYESQAAIPLETSFSTIRTFQFDHKGNEQFLSNSLESIEERREIATIRLAHYQHRLGQGYDKGIKVRIFVPGDLVLRKVIGNMKNPAQGKLGPTQEGPYRVTLMAGIGTYRRLGDFDENPLHRPWNVNNLCRYYY